MDITIHHHYNKTRRDAQAEGDRKIRRFSRPEWLLVLLTAMFCAVCLLRPIPEGVQVAVQRETQAAAQETQEKDWPDSLLPGERIDVNTAPEKDLQRLPGIGESRAARIVEHRTQNGRFERIEDLVAVYGIGEGILEQIRPYVTVGGG